MGDGCRFQAVNLPGCKFKVGPADRGAVEIILLAKAQPRDQIKSDLSFFL